MKSNRVQLFSSESVTEGHPDKLCDQISDAVLDAILAEDSEARVACECFCTTGLVVVSGEISTTAKVDIQSIVRSTVRRVGYTRAKYGFDADSCGVLLSIKEQSADIARGVNSALETRSLTQKNQGQEAPLTGAGDQGLMFGFACNETESYLPLPIELAHKLCMRLSAVRKTGVLPLLRPDGKAQVTIAYEGFVPKYVHTIVVSSQHSPNYNSENLRRDIINEVIKSTIPSNLLREDTRILVNPTGRFVIGGPMGDVGLTGRKIIVDTYGGMSAHGGGCFSGKDPTKVDRSATYMARYIAKNMVAAGLADRLQIQLAYSIGVAKPISIAVESYGTAKLAEDSLIDIISNHFDLTPDGIIKTLNLRRPIYQQTAAYGHFGRDDLNLPWESLDKVEELRKYL